ncbi:MAG: hypothetical protein IJS61_10240 [Firmicutes bacterium]|nr:hypothetical protein [Bacillota bacterium]
MKKHIIKTLTLFLLGVSVVLPLSACNTNKEENVEAQVSEESHDDYMEPVEKIKLLLSGAISGKDFVESQSPVEIRDAGYKRQVEEGLYQNVDEARQKTEEQFDAIAQQYLMMGDTSVNYTVMLDAPMSKEDVSEFKNELKEKYKCDDFEIDDGRMLYLSLEAMGSPSSFTAKVYKVRGQWYIESDL